MRLFATLAAGSIALVGTMGTASAAVVWATGWNDLIAGENGPGDPDAIPAQTNPNNALGAPTLPNGYFSPGIGGQIDFTFGRSFGGNDIVTVFEVTIGDQVESADVFAVNSDTGVTDYIGSVLNQNAQDGFTFEYAGMPFNEIRIIDTSFLGTDHASSNDSGVAQGANGSFDGFDVNAVGVGVAPIPLPATALLLLGGLAGLGAIGRKKS